MAIIAPPTTNKVNAKQNEFSFASTGAKAIGTAWTIAPSEEEESIWGEKNFDKRELHFV